MIIREPIGDRGGNKTSSDSSSEIVHVALDYANVWKGYIFGASMVIFFIIKRVFSSSTYSKASQGT